MTVFPNSLMKKAAWSNQISPSWDITEQKTASGRRRSLITQSMASYTFSYTFPCLTDDELGQLLGFFNARKGGFEPFYVSDYVKGKVEGQTLARGSDGNYQLFASMGDYAEQVLYATDITVYVDGIKTTDFSLNSNGALQISSATASSVVTADYRWYWRVVFKDSITITEMFYNANKVTMKLEVAR